MEDIIVHISDRDKLKEFSELVRKYYFNIEDVGYDSLYDCIRLSIENKYFKRASFDFYIEKGYNVITYEEFVRDFIGIRIKKEYLNDCRKVLNRNIINYSTISEEDFSILKEKVENVEEWLL